ncbi:MAG: hypothetical protein ACJAT2_000162 [Bacteriovoracaceae bacterium]
MSDKIQAKEIIMKLCLQAIITFLLITGGSAQAQVSNTNNGTAPQNLGAELNQGVIDSQANNEKYYNQALQNPSVEPGAVIQPSANGAMTQTPDGPERSTELNLTDAEKRLSEEFVHDGKALREQKEACDALEDPDACRGSEPKSKFMGIDSTMVKAISQMYSLVIGMGESGLSNKNTMNPPKKAKGGTKTETKPADKGKEDKDSTEDYCKYIAVAIEGYAFFAQTQSAKVANIPEGQTTSQKEVLYKAARSHKDRAKTHTVQEVGWGATTACYIGMLSMTPASWANWGNVAKLAASTTMYFFFRDQADLNKEYYKKIKKIADDLPGKGDCNPVTEKDCYCGEEETMNDPNVCLPELHKQKVKLGNYRVACLDAQGKVDPKCTCIDANACLDNKFMSQVKPFGFGSAFHSAATKPLSNLARGQLTAGDISSSQNGSQNAFIKKGLRDIASKVPSAGQLTSAQQKTVSGLNDLGLPPQLGATFSKAPVTASLNGNSFKGRYLGARSARRSYARAKKRGNVLNFSGGRGSRKKVARKTSGNQFNKYLKKFGKKGKGRSSSKVLNYSDQAMRDADINKDKSRPIFEIISRRYKVSGYKRLNIE